MEKVKLMLWFGAEGSGKSDKGLCWDWAKIAEKSMIELEYNI